MIFTGLLGTPNLSPLVLLGIIARVSLGALVGVLDLLGYQLIAGTIFNVTVDVAVVIGTNTGVSTTAVTTTTVTTTTTTWTGLLIYAWLFCSRLGRFFS